MKIRNAKGRSDGNSGYTRTLGNEALGKLISKVQATVISNGTELERLLVERCVTIIDIEEFIDTAEDGGIENGTYLCQKKTFKKSTRYAVEGIKGVEPDLLIFIVQRRRICKVIELKDGDMFDTKKSQSEKEHLEIFTTNFGARIPFTAEYYICCFNQEDKNKIKSGFKDVFSINHIMTGTELCSILNIDIDEIKAIRKNDTKDNFNYFIEQLLLISQVKKEIIKKIEK